MNPYKVTDEWYLLECKQCKKYKNLSMYYKHKQWYLWVLWRCKECILLGRKTEPELLMSRKRDADRYYNNEKRRNYIFASSKERRKEKWYWKIHLKTSRKIKKLWIRPDKCPLCGRTDSRIEAHHFNYNYWYKVIFACSICHSKLDQWKINYKDCDIYILKCIK